MQPVEPAAGGPWNTAAGDAASTHLFTRTTDDGITIRVYRLASMQSCVCNPVPVGVPSGTTGIVAPGAVASGGISVEMSDVIAVGDGILWGGPGGGTEPLSATSGTFGVVEGSPVWWIAVSVGAEVSNVQVTFADGSTDQMTPVDGVAVLARQIGASTAESGDGSYAVRATLRLLTDAGDVVASLTFPQPPPAPVPVSPPVALPGSVSSSSPPGSLSTPGESSSTSKGSPSASPSAAPGPSEPLPAPALEPPPADPGSTIVCS